MGFYEIGQDSYDDYDDDDADDLLGEDEMDLLLGEDEMDLLLGMDQDDAEMLGFSFKKFARSALMPHTLVTDRLPKRVQTLLDPIGSATRHKRKRARRRAVSRKRNAMSAIRNQAAQRATIVQRKEPTSSKRLILGVDSVATIAAGASLTLNVNPTNPFKAERFQVDPTIAVSFLINDIKIGRKSQFLSGGAVPASAFAAVAVGSGIDFDTAQISQNIQVAVTNTSGAALRFNGAFIGQALE